MRVLIVENEPLIAISLAAELRLAGHDVLGPSTDADEALCLAGDHKADLALVDVELHGTMDGIELARTLHAQCDVPTLLLTTEPVAAHAHNSDAAMGIITLPFDPSELPESVHAAETVLRGGELEAPNIPSSLQLFGTWTTSPSRVQ
jgi:two-component system, response regulator PdtaR